MPEIHNVHFIEQEIEAYRAKEVREDAELSRLSRMISEAIKNHTITQFEAIGLFAKLPH